MVVATRHQHNAWRFFSGAIERKQQNNQRQHGCRTEPLGSAPQVGDGLIRYALIAAPSQSLGQRTRRQGPGCNEQSRKPTSEQHNKQRTVSSQLAEANGPDLGSARNATELACKRSVQCMQLYATQQLLAFARVLCK